MLSKLSASDGAEHLGPAIGKTIASAAVNKHKWTNGSYTYEIDRLELRFTDATGIALEDDAQSCCETRYMSSDDDLSEYTGAKLLSVELREAPSISTDEDYNVHDVQFLAVITDKGEFTCSSHNEHNGYYNGFSIIVKEIV